MPELPEVESIRRQLVTELTGRRIVHTWSDPRPAPRQSALDGVTGRRIEAVRRRGKYLLLPLVRGGAPAELELILHLGMSGSLYLDDRDGARRTDHVRARIRLDDGRTLFFRDPRRFGRVSVVAFGCHATIPTLAALGPEPLDDAFEPGSFADALARSRAPVKACLLSQRIVAGVGNIYADEALWRARIHPASRRVGAERARRLHGAIRAVLAEAIDREGTTFRDHRLVNGASGRFLPLLDAYGRQGLPCRRCRTTLRRRLVAQRGTTYCPCCQRA